MVPFPRRNPPFPSPPSGRIRHPFAVLPLEGIFIDKDRDPPLQALFKIPPPFPFRSALLHFLSLASFSFPPPRQPADCPVFSPFLCLAFLNIYISLLFALMPGFFSLILAVSVSPLLSPPPQEGSGRTFLLRLPPLRSFGIALSRPSDVMFYIPRLLGVLRLPLDLGSLPALILRAVFFFFQRWLLMFCRDR